MNTTILTLTLASTNAGKLIEIESFMANSGLSVQVVMPSDLEEVEETGQTFLENALLKASSAKISQVSGETHYILAEDSGFEVPALAGMYGLDPFPGIYSSRWMTQAIREELLGIEADFETLPLNYEHINAGILKLMESQEDRSARYVASLVLQTSNHQTIFEGMGAVNMEIISDNNPQGTQGFGYDPIVCPGKAERTLLNWPLNLSEIKTMAELPTEEKNIISHRGKALAQLTGFLKERFFS